MGGMKREGNGDERKGEVRAESERNRTHHVKDIRDWFEMRIKDGTGSTMLERRETTTPTTPRLSREVERGKRSFSPGRSPMRARSGWEERMAGDTGLTAPDPAHKHPGPTGLLRRWLHTGPTISERGVQGTGSARQPSISAQKGHVPNSKSPNNLPGTPIENPTLEELCSRA